MKRLIHIVAFIIMATPALRSQDSLMGPHGGTLKTGSDFNIELVECYEYMEVYLFDFYMRPILNHHVDGDIKYYSRDNKFMSYPLVKYGVDGFSCKRAENNFVYCIVTLTLDGRPASARFENNAEKKE